MFRYSDDGGRIWTKARRLGSPQAVTSQFLPAIAVDQATGYLAVGWYDFRNSLGQGGAGCGEPDSYAQFWATISTDGGRASLPAFQVSQGTSNSMDSKSSFEYGTTRTWRSNPTCSTRHGQITPTAPPTTRTAPCTGWTSTWPCSRCASPLPLRSGHSHEWTWHLELSPLVNPITKLVVAYCKVVCAASRRTSERATGGRGEGIERRALATGAHALRLLRHGPRDT